MGIRSSMAQAKTRLAQMGNKFSRAFWIVLYVLTAIFMAAVIYFFYLIYAAMAVPDMAGEAMDQMETMASIFPILFIVIFALGLMGGLAAWIRDACRRLVHKFRQPK